MKYTTLLLAVLFLATSLGCYGVSTIERENLTRPEERENYIRMNPEGLYNACIRNGEITRGMNIYEVIASWGLPNVYLVSNKVPEERWIYYVEDDHSKSILIYTLIFLNDNLENWDIDMKRFVDYRVAYDPVMPVESRNESSSTLKKN